MPFVRIGMSPRLRGTSMEELDQRWREHGELAVKMDGLRRYVQNHRIADLDAGLPFVGHDVYAELEFDDFDGMRRAYGSDYYQGAVFRDEHRFAEVNHKAIILADRESVRAEPVGVAPVRLLTFLRRDPRRSKRDFLRVLRGARESAVLAAGPVSYERLVAAPARVPEDRSSAEAVEIIGFDSRDAAVAFVAQSAVGEEAALTIAGVVFGSVYAITRPILILDRQVAR